MKLKKLAKKGLQAIDIKDIYGQVGIGMLLIYCIKKPITCHEKSMDLVLNYGGFSYGGSYILIIIGVTNDDF